MLPWFRVHIVLLNDPGRLISVHLIHTGLICGWSCMILLYEILIIEKSDFLYNPIWRQGSYVFPFIIRLGITVFNFGWCFNSFRYTDSVWTIELISVAHLVLAGLLFMSALFHWAYWDLQIFISNSGFLFLDLISIFSIHLLLSSLVCFGFGMFHLTGLWGPGFWTSDLYGLVGSIRTLKPTYSILFFKLGSYSILPSHHIAAGLLGVLISIWKINSRSSFFIFKTLSLGNIESVLSSSLVSVFWFVFIIVSEVWYGSCTLPLELNGPTRYMWDSGYFNLEIEKRSSSLYGSKNNLRNFWLELPDKLCIYDYIGSNPAKGGLFRSGPILKGDGLIKSWIGNIIFEIGTSTLSVRRIPSFFENFPTLIIDKGGKVRSDIPFRRSESFLSIETIGITLYVDGGLFNGVEYFNFSIVKSLIRKAAYGQVFIFNRDLFTSNGSYRTSIRGWYSFSHLAFSFIFVFGHIWHGCRALFRDIWTGVILDKNDVTLNFEYGRREKLGSIGSPNNFKD